MLREKKPTGNEECPVYLPRAFALEDAISQRIGTRAVGDEDIVDVDLVAEDDVVEVLDDEDDNPTPPSAHAHSGDIPTPKPPSFVARRATPSQPRAGSARSAASALLDSVATALDPGPRQA